MSKATGRKVRRTPSLRTRLDPGGGFLLGRRGGGLGGVELVGVEPDDPGDPVAGDGLGVEVDLDVEFGGVHGQDPASEVVAADGSDELGGRAVLLHPGESEHPFALGLAHLDPDGVERGKFDRLDPGVGDERPGGQGRGEADPFLVDRGDLAGDHVAGPEVEGPAGLVLPLGGGVGELADHVVEDDHGVLGAGRLGPGGGRRGGLGLGVGDLAGDAGAERGGPRRRRPARSGSRPRPGRRPASPAGGPRRLRGRPAARPSRPGSPRAGARRATGARRGAPRRARGSRARRTRPGRPRPSGVRRRSGCRRPARPGPTSGPPRRAWRGRRRRSGRPGPWTRRRRP